MFQKKPITVGAEGKANERRRGAGWIIFIAMVVLLLLGGGGWYYFFGQKPRVVLTASLAEGTGEAMWPIGPDGLLILADRELKLIDINGRAIKWTTKLPAAPEANASWRNSVNARFLRLQQWADELTRKRANLRTAEETTAFNAEAAKYQAELTAARAEWSNPKGNSSKSLPPAPAASKPAAVAVAAPAKVEATNPATALKPVVSAEAQLLEQRIKRRATKIKEFQQSAAKKKAAAKTEIQRAAAQEEEARHQALVAEQKADEASLAELSGQPRIQEKPAPRQAQEREPEAEEESMFVESAKPFAGLVGNLVWVVEENHIASFDRGSGAIQSDVLLAGPVVRTWSLNDEIYVVASAGPQSCQITRIGGSGPVSLYTATGALEQLEIASSEKPAIPAVRTAFAGPLVRADIKLVEEKLTVRDAIKPGSDAALVDTIKSSAAHSSDELDAIAKLIAQDGARLTGETKTWQDESTYEVTLRKPLEPGAPEWKGTVQGNVQVLATTKYLFLAAGTQLLVFDHTNRKLWEATLGAPMPQNPEDPAPILEAGDRLYFADGAFLTAFDGGSGKVHWRVPSVGIRKLQLDVDGNLYVHSLNQPVDALTYATEGDVETNPITMKIQAEDGKIAWQVEKYQDLWVSGRDVYVLRETRSAQDVENMVFDSANAPEARLKVYKLRRSSGSPIWEWFQPRRPQAVHAERKNVALLFGSEFQMIHSIAL